MNNGTGFICGFLLGMIVLAYMMASVFLHWTPDVDLIKKGVAEYQVDKTTGVTTFVITNLNAKTP